MIAFSKANAAGRMTYSPQRNSLKRQRGATLLVGVIFLIVLTLLGVSAATISALDEKMARNLRDRNIAFQAAEASLRDARRDILISRKVKGYSGFPAIAADGSATCNNGVDIGLCRPATAINTVPAWEVFLEDANRSVAYGSKTNLSTAQKFTSSTIQGGVTAQPRYIIEVLPDPNTTESLKPGSVIKVLYRISSIGYGSNDGTRVLLQEVIRP